MHRDVRQRGDRDAFRGAMKERGAVSLSRRDGLLWLALLMLAVVAGAALRWYQLRIQVILDDEWHALNKLLSADAWSIATNFGYADYSIPLTLYYRFLLLHGGLTEWVMHLPMLASGIALLIIAPLLLRRETTLPVRAVWVALLATSPLLVYHSKVARPYALTSLLTFVAIIAFRRWWLRREGTLAWGTAYVGATLLAGWLHLVTLPFTLLPFVYFGVLSLVSPQLRESPGGRFTAIGRLLRLGIATTVPLAAVLLPPLLNDWADLSAKTSTHAVTFESAYRTLLMLFGVAQPALFALLLAVTGLGAFHCWQRDRTLFLYLVVVILGAATAIGLAHSPWIHHPGVLGRYLIPALPFLLLFLAEGAVECLQLLRSALLQVPLTVVLALLLVWAGPIPGYFYYPNQFMGHLRFQYDYDAAHNPYVQLIPRDPVPEFYRQLAKRAPASLTLIEAPWRLESNFNPHAWYQEVHRQMVKIGLVTPVCGVWTYGEYPASVKGLRLHQFAHLSEVLAGKNYGADYLVMHLVPWKTPPDAEVEWPDVAACLPVIEAKLGSPVFRDAQIAVFDLRKERPLGP